MNTSVLLRKGKSLKKRGLNGRVTTETVIHRTSNDAELFHKLGKAQDHDNGWMVVPPKGWAASQPKHPGKPKPLHKVMDLPFKGGFG